MSMQNNDTIKSGDIYCGQRRKTGKYYQIIDVKKEIMTYLLLDYFDEKFPDEKAVKEMKPFRRHRWFFKEGTTNYSHSERNKLPEGAAYAGHRTPLFRVSAKFMVAGQTDMTMSAKKNGQRSQQMLVRNSKLPLMIRLKL